MTEESPKPLPYQSTIERFPEYAQTIGMISIEILLKIRRIVTAVMKETATVFRSWPPYASQEIPRGQPQSENNPSERLTARWPGIDGPPAKSGSQTGHFDIRHRAGSP
jgi:hypothetical protein